MAEQFLHGVEVLNIDTGSRTIQAVSTSVVGIVGTAPNADPDAFPVDTPVLMAGGCVFRSNGRAILMNSLLWG